MQPNEDIARGFFFALELLRRLGVQWDQFAVESCLNEIARGETSVYNSIEEEIAAEETRRGTAMEQEERNVFRAALANRGVMDLQNRRLAMHIIEVIQRSRSANTPVD